MYLSNDCARELVGRKIYVITNNTTNITFDMNTTFATFDFVTI
jgi:hypothetical protein